ncbi:hypothetical protein TRIP_E190296 [uncultured Spirochaetota bacterium]|uniref:Uncharacterized protein n=1 Tax=uncultured Spirochaetota bacterium TaxID=460511 RepID=A0A652ZUB4_9SPIR|nr:hypothetical protein TRIP_E190296 [uncultured Spirochaetota bacterium]
MLPYADPGAYLTKTLYYYSFGNFRRGMDVIGVNFSSRILKTLRDKKYEIIKRSLECPKHF